MSQENAYYVAKYAAGIYAVMPMGSLRPVKVFKTQKEAEQRVQELVANCASANGATVTPE